MQNKRSFCMLNGEIQIAKVHKIKRNVYIYKEVSGNIFIFFISVSDRKIIYSYNFKEFFVSETENYPNLTKFM